MSFQKKSDYYITRKTMTLIIEFLEIRGLNTDSKSSISGPPN